MTFFPTKNQTNTSNSSGNSQSSPNSTFTPTADASDATAVVPGNPSKTGEMNVAEYSAQVATDPSKGMTPDMKLGDNTPEISEQEVSEGQVSDSSLQNYNTSLGQQTASQGTAAQANTVDPRQAQTYDAELSEGKVEDAAMESAQGTVRDEALVNADDVTIDTDAVARGETEVGKALQEFAEQKLDEVDPKATVRGQLEQLQSDFTDPITGGPRIPAWAAETARSVSKIAAFSGMTGSAATAAMAQAMMEASISMAEKDASFFQTLTLQNLNNKQQATINRANVLAQMDMANMDARMTAAVTNAKSFMEMDLANLSNEQQARMINTQARVQAILEDSKAVNAQRLFTAQSQNEMDMFYDNLSSQIEQFNTNQKNAMTQFNVSEENGIKKFNADLENQRDQFYRSMQYNIDVANAQWRQTVTLTNNKNKFEAAALDVKNAVGISQEALNQLWDRSDALLDYVWKSAENQLDREAALAQISLNGRLSNKAATTSGIGSIIGNVAGALIGKLDIF